MCYIPEARPMVIHRPFYYLVTLLLILSLPLNAQKGKINYSDKNMRWIISRLNTELTFEEFNKRFKGAAIGSQDDLKSFITAVKGIEGEIYFFSDKYITYRVFVDKNNKAIYAKAGQRLGSKEDKTAQKGLYNTPVYTYDGGTYVSTYPFRDSNDPMVHFVEDGRSQNYLLWGDRANQLLVRLTMFSDEFDGIEVMVNGWYENGDIQQWRRKDNKVKQPMDYNQLLSIDELQRPKQMVALRSRIEKAWSEGKVTDLFNLDLSLRQGICVAGCDDPNGNQKVYYGNLYYEGPMKKGLPHGQAQYLAMWHNSASKLNYLIKGLPLDYKLFSAEKSMDITFVNGKAQGKGSFSYYSGLSITYDQGLASYIEDYKPKAKFSVFGSAKDVKYIKGPMDKGKWSLDIEVHIENTRDSSFVIYKGQMNDNLQAHGKGTYYQSKSDKRNKSREWIKEVNGSLEGTWIRGSLSRKYLIKVKGKQYQSSGIGLSSVYTSTGLAVGEKVTVINNKIPEYRTTGKMIGPDPNCPEGVWTLEKLNISTYEYEPFPLTDEYVFEKGYCMFKATYDANGNKVEELNIMGMSEYVTPEARDIMIAQAKQDKEEKERLEAIAQAKREKEEAEAREKRAEAARQREYAQLANFESLLRQYTDSDVKIASRGWMTNFPSGETTGSAGIFIINTNKSSRTFSGTVSFSHRTKGDETKNITLRVGGADSSGYGGAKTSFDLGFGSPYQLSLNLDGNPSGVYYFIYYFGLLIK